MKFFALVCILLGAVASVLGQTITLTTPTDGAVLKRGQKFTSQITQPISMASCIQVGIALAVANCNNGVCPQPAAQLGSVLYAGPWKPTLHTPGGYYQNFTLTVPTYLSPGPAIFSLTHLCLLGAGPYPLLEYRTASVTIS